MILKELKKISLSEILVIILLVIILLQRCGGGKKETPEAPKIVRDTVWVTNTGTTITKPTVTTTVPYTVTVDHWNTQYLPDTSSMSKLVKQYEELVRKFLATNIQKDSVKIDSIGHVYITDSVTSNVVKNRLVTWNLKYPVITTTITIPEPKRVQWYVGGTVQGEQGSLISQINANLLIKNKKDQMFGGYVGLNRSGAMQIGISTYWKIKIK
jgi:hypothetical protein